MPAADRTEEASQACAVITTLPDHSPGRIGLIARAALVLVLFEHKMIT